MVVRWDLFCFCLARRSSVSTSRTRDAGPVGLSFNLPRPFYASSGPMSNRAADGGQLASRILGFSAAHARSPKELSEGEAGDQRAATNAGCEQNQFFGDDLHSSSCPVGDEGGGPLLALGCAVFIGTGTRHG